MGLKRSGERILIERLQLAEGQITLLRERLDAYKDVLTLLHPRAGVWVTPTDAEERLIDSLLESNN